ncbi:MAG: DUF1178 family protein [Pontixanthobacter sp.]
MIVFDLTCDRGHRFEGWFSSSSEFVDQCEHDLVECPQCGSTAVMKAPMAPAVGAKSNRELRGLAKQQAHEEPKPKPVANQTMPPALRKAIATLAKAQAKALKDSTWVGKAFAEKSRQIHYGETDHHIIHGEATKKEAQELVDEGIAVAPLPFPVKPPEDVN